MSFHSDVSSKRSRQDGRTTDFHSKRAKSNWHSTSSFSAVRTLKSPKLRSKSPQRSSCSSSSSIQAKKITFFRNGDPFFRGVVLPISSKIYPSIDSLILDANRHPICDVSVLPKGIRYIFSTDGRRITSLDELQEGRGYVFSSTELFKPLQYGSADPILSRNRSPADTHQDGPPSPSYGEQDPIELSVSGGDRSFVQSRTIYVIRAGLRPRYMTKVTLDHKTATSLDQVIGSLEQNLMMREGGIKHLCSVSGNEVKWLEDLFQEDTIFIAFATEIISPDDLLLSAAELNSYPAVTKTPSASVWSNSLPRFSSNIKKPKIVTVVNRGRAGDDLGIPFTLLSKYRMGKTVIWTDYAVMKCCYDKADSQQAMAMKIFDKARLTDDELDAIYYELSMLRRLKHSNILQFIDEMDTVPELYVIVEYFKGADLMDAILLSEFFTEREAGCLMAQLCSAISYLHSLRIVHRNIKPENILVSYDRQGVHRQLRLAGLAVAMEIGEDSVSKIWGTLEYTAPEMLQGPCYGTKVDVWSAGVVCYQMLSGMLPFTCKASGDQQQLIQNIMSGHLDFPSPFWDSVSDSVKDLILHMLTRNPELRCKASDVLNHSWLQTTTSQSSNFRWKNVDIRNTVAANLEVSRPWAPKAAKSCHMLLASSFCCRRKPYKECTGSPGHEPGLSFSSHSALSCSDSDQSLFNVSLSPKGHRHISCPSAVGGNQNDANHGDTNRSRPSLDQNSPLPTGMAVVDLNKINSTHFDFNSSTLCLDQSSSLPCNTVLVDSLKIDTSCGKFDSSQLCQDLSASVLTCTNSSTSDIFSCHSVSILNTSSSESCISAVKQPCTVSTQTTSSELLLPPSAICLPKAPADNIFPSSSSCATSSVLSNKVEVIHPITNSCRPRVPFPLSLLFSSISSPSALYSVKPLPPRNTAVSLNADNQVMTAELHLTSLGSGQPSGQDLSSGRPTNTKSASAGSASSGINSADMENSNLLSSQSLALSHGQNSPSPAMTLPPSNLLCSTFSQSGLPVLQFLVSSAKAASSQTQSQSKPASSASLSPLAQCSLVPNPTSQCSTQAYQNYQLASAKSKYASLSTQDSQRIQDFPRSSLQSTQALTAASDDLPSLPENTTHPVLQQGLSTLPTTSNFHPVHEQSNLVNNAATNSQPQSPVTYGSPSQMLTAALKSFDPEDQGYTKDARLQSSGTPKLKMNLAKVAVETAYSMSCNLQENPDAEQTGERRILSTSPAHSKDSTSSSSSLDEFVSPSSSIQDASGYSSSHTHLSCLSEDDNDDAQSTSGSSRTSIENLN